MSGKRVLLMLLVLSVSVNLAVVGMVGARRIAHSEPALLCGRECRLTESEHRLSLDPAQREEFARLTEEFKALRMDRQARMAELRDRLVAEVLGEKPDRERIEALLSEMHEQQTVVQRKLIEHLLAQKKVLRPEQVRAYRDDIEQHLLHTETAHASINHPH